MVVPSRALYLGSYKVIPKRNHNEASLAFAIHGRALGLTRGGVEGFEFRV